MKVERLDDDPEIRRINAAKKAAKTPDELRALEHAFIARIDAITLESRKANAPGKPAVLPDVHPSHPAGWGKVYLSPVSPTEPASESDT